MKSENYTIEAPMSFTGSARRLWRLSDNIVWRLTALFVVIPMAWCAVGLWYCLFGILVIPYRLVRRHQRKEVREAIRHRELIEASKR